MYLVVWRWSARFAWAAAVTTFADRDAAARYVARHEGRSGKTYHIVGPVDLTV